MKLGIGVVCALAALAGGCSSPSGRDPDGGTGGCSVTGSGAATVSESCMAMVCKPVGATSEALTLATSSVKAAFEADGMLAARSYAVADLRGFNILLTTGGKSYAAGKGVSGAVIAGSTTALTIESLQGATVGKCDGSAHGTATATLVEYDAMSGMPTGTGVVSLSLQY